jgi:hypothetical protein
MWSFLTRLRQAGIRYREARTADVPPGRDLRDWCLEEFGFELARHDKGLVKAGQHLFFHDGAELSREPHVKVDDFKDPSRCGRIYFAIDTAGQRFVVDHIGLHLQSGRARS